MAKDEEALTREELAEADGERLPDRHVMSVIRGVEPLPVPLVPDGEAIPLDDPVPDA